MDQGAPPAIVCSVQAEPSRGGLMLRGRVVASLPAQGAYRLEVEKAGPTGRSTVSQGGAFQADPGREAQVGNATFDFPPRTRITARLTLTADGRVYSCESHEDNP